MAHHNVYRLLSIIAGVGLITLPGACAADNNNVPPVAPLTAPVAHELPAPTPAPVMAERPLMIIRFNASYVHYQNSLILAVTKAKEADRNVKFKVISYVPMGATGEKAKMNLSSVVQQIRDLGIDPAHISANTQPAEVSMAGQEIHIFVE